MLPDQSRNLTGERAVVDALLYSVRDTVRNTNFGWDERTSDILGDGRPPSKTAAWFLAIHQESERGDMMNALDEYYGYTLTLSLLLQGTPRDRIGKELLSNLNVRTLAKETGFNARAQQLKTFLHMNWFVIGLANQYLCQMYAESFQVDGFCEPAHWSDTLEPKFVGGEWFGADPNAADAGIMTEIRFEGARRLQAIATYT